MGVLDSMVKGAFNQFGREFGRAAANSVLNGRNSQKVELIDRYSGRLKPSDTPVIRAMKNIQNIDFVLQDKANISRLIEITDEFINVIRFNGDQSLSMMDDIYTLENIYNDKYAHGIALINSDYNDKTVDYLNLKRDELDQSIKEFQSSYKEFVLFQQTFYKNKKIKRELLLLWSFPIWGSLGIHNFYLGKPTKAITHLILCWTIIFPIINIIEFLSVLFMNKNDFELKYNPEYLYYSQFVIS
jgi:TM2 domain-containing membrane protein YozV